MFESVHGHGPILSMLRNMHQKEAIPNALCFHGVNGIGKRKVARELAQAKLCQTQNACGTCGPCKKFLSGLDPEGKTMHPDYKEIEPDGPAIKVGPVREISENLHYKPFEASCRIFLIDQAETMNEGAANAFLKSLEEPPAYVYFFLIASDLDKLLPTIRSRCQKIAFQPLTVHDKEQILMQSFQIEPVMASKLARISYRRLETDTEAWDLFHEHVNRILSYFRTIVSSGVAMSYFSDIIRAKRDLYAFYDHFTACLREALMRSKGLPGNPLFHEWDTLFMEITKKVRTEDWIQAMDSFLYFMRHKRRNLNPDLWFNQFSVNELGQYRKSESVHRLWLQKKSV